MKKLFALVLALGLLVPAAADPLSTKQVSGDAKWLLHVDLDGFRTTKVGSFVTKELLEKKIERKIKEAGTELGTPITLDVKKIASVTAYGTAFQHGRDAQGVLLIQTGQNIQAIVNSVIEAISKKVPEGERAPVKVVQKDPFIVYSVGDDLFASVYERELLLLGKSRDQIDNARDVLAGKRASLTAGNAFSMFPAAAGGFFFLAVAEGFNESSHLPPQAKVLQMADGIRVILGEKADLLFANLALKAKTAEATAQIREVVQGMVALVSLSQPENQELLELARSLKVSSSENLVTVNLEFPVAKAIEKLSTAVKEHSE